MSLHHGVPFLHGGVFCQLSEVNRQYSDYRAHCADTDAATAADSERRKEEARATPVPVPVPGAVAPLPIWQRLGPLTRGAEAYARAQRRRPWVTQVATMLVIYLCADISAQQISGKDEHEYARTARSLTIGGVAAIPGHIWFVFLSQHFNYPSKVLSVAVKVAINQAVFTPLFNTYFFGGQALLSGDSLEQAWDRVRATVPVSVVNSCKVWPAVTAVSFAYLPLEYRALFAGVVAVGWQTYLSFLNRQAEAAEALALAAEVGSRKERGAVHHSRIVPVAGPTRSAAEIGGTDRNRIAA
ncbi:Mpv17/PMP22 family protein [Apiospora marii]|uniref:Mpv17/PMP22 family protein n=1 Tax=Apiospora marii TaxID=335849 RepID=UPI003130CF6D